MSRFSTRFLFVVAASFFGSPVTALLAQNSGEIVARPRFSPGPIDNPLKGWCPYTDAGKITQPYSMVFQYISWREIEPYDGEFRFDQWEQSWNEGPAKDKHIVFRVYIDYPSKPSGLPDWVRRAGIKETAYSDYGGGKSPDYNNPKMIQFIERLIAALGKRYNHNPRIAFVQLGVLGFWGEWHTYPRTELYASPETEQRVIDAYRKAFPNKILMVRNASGYAGRQSWIGFHDDMFPEDTDNGKDWSFLAGLRKAGRAENWRQAAIGGEMVPGKAEQWMIGDIETTKAMLESSHFTWVGPYCPALVESKAVSFADHSKTLVQRMGYNFQIAEIKHPSIAGETTKITLKGNNIGVASFYYLWHVEWALLDKSDHIVSSYRTKWDIRQWQPGTFQESCEAKLNAPAGKYRLAIGIRDPWRDRPAIKFANELMVANGWNVVSELEID